ncbi:Bro-N domain-containing protein [Niveibacterium sp. SC-1]|uniref:BRO-N domain-containing protein n=1 Tax=Niveibacterium sp. SC-1 TaxID=3135646 RepID=UPI00311EE874
MSEVIPFAFDSHAVRVVMQDGEPWFVAADILSTLTLDRKALERLDEDERGVSSIHTPSRNQHGDFGSAPQQMTIVSEPGMYSLVLGSRKPEAKRFKRWVTHEVLPTLRKTGSYAMPGAAHPLPPSVSHRADHIVAATRSFNGLMRAAVTLKLGHLRAVRSATAATLRHTGVDLLAELGVQEHELAPALEAPAAPFSLAERFAAAWVAGELPVPFAPCTTGQLYRALQAWAQDEGEPAAPAQAIASTQIGRWAGNRLSVRSVRLGTTGKVVRLWIPAGEGPAADMPMQDWAERVTTVFETALRAYAVLGERSGHHII